MSNNIQGKVVVITDASSGLGEARARSDRTRSADQPHRSTEGGAPITAWTSDELDKIAAAEELQIASVRRDGALRNPATIWVVRHGDDLYVRSWRGRTSSWFRGTQEGHEGRIGAGGVDKDVLFVEADDDVNDEIEAAYRTKYRRYGARHVDPMVSREARAATIKLVPRSSTASPST